MLTKEEATVYVKELDLFVTLMLLEDTQAVLSLENSAKVTGKITIGPVVRKPQIIKHGRRMECKTANYVPFVVPGLIDKLFKLIFTYEVRV